MKHVSMCPLVVLFVASTASAHAGHGELRIMLGEYDAVRAALASDDYTAAVAGAKKLAEASHKAHGAVAAKMKAQLGAIAKAADALAKTEAEPTKLRLA